MSSAQTSSWPQTSTLKGLGAAKLSRPLLHGDVLRPSRREDEGGERWLESSGRFDLGLEGCHRDLGTQQAILLLALHTLPDTVLTAENIDAGLRLAVAAVPLRRRVASRCRSRGRGRAFRILRAGPAAGKECSKKESLGVEVVAPS